MNKYKKILTDLFKTTGFIILKFKQSDIFIFLQSKRSVQLSLLFIFAALLFTFRYGVDKTQTPKEVCIPLESPFKNSICGDGLIECNTKNLTLGPYASGIISDIPVKEGDHVKKGDTLIQMDDNILKHDVALNEDSVNIALAEYNEAHDEHERSQDLKTGVISAKEKKRRQFQYDKALANVNAEKEKLNISKIKLAQTKIVAPTDGKILKIVPTIGSHLLNTDKAIIMGSIDPLHIRVQVDETDISDFKSSAEAVAIERHPSSKPISLEFVRVEPIAQTKTTLMGSSRELIDTRVVEIIYKMPKSDHLYIGQRIDVYINRQN